MAFDFRNGYRPKYPRRLKGDLQERRARVYQINEKSERLWSYSRRLALKVEHLRKSRVLTQSALAGEVGIRQQGISEIEAGWANPNLLFLVKLAEYFGVEIGDLFVSPFEED